MKAMGIKHALMSPTPLHLLLTYEPGSLGEKVEDVEREHKRLRHQGHVASKL